MRGALDAATVLRGFLNNVLLFSLLLVPAAVYQLLAIAAGVHHLFRRRDDLRRHKRAFQPPVSVLKPLRGMDPNTVDAFVSQVQQNYPNFEVLFGARDENDPAVRAVRRLQENIPSAAVRLCIGSAPAANSKVGVLIELARHAKNPIWVVNDSDIKVDPDYLSRVVAPLANPFIGLITCPYRVRAHNLPAAWEAFGIAADFMPSTLVAQLIGVREFGLGSTLAFRAEDLAAAGGFQSIADYLADDYQLAKRITGRGKRAVLSTYTVETSLGDATWTGIWRHQLRWARTIRASKGLGYAGLPITSAGLWALVGFACGVPRAALLLLGLRLCAALVSGGFVVESAPVARFFWLAPLWDLYSFSIWVASYAGRGVRWRDQVLVIDREGRIQT